jgi:H+/Cl- antiporter ClcA
MQGFVIQALFVTPPGTFKITSLILFSCIYYLLAALTYGAFIPSGLFTVGLIFGGCFGRTWAEILIRMHLIDATVPGITGMYALLGAGEYECEVTVSLLGHIIIDRCKAEWSLTIALTDSHAAMIADVYLSWQ